MVRLTLFLQYYNQMFAWTVGVAKFTTVAPRTGVSCDENHVTAQKRVYFVVSILILTNCNLSHMCPFHTWFTIWPPVNVRATTHWSVATRPIQSRRANIGATKWHSPLSPSVRRWSVQSTLTTK